MLSATRPIKTREGEVKYKGIRDAATRIIKEEGMRALYTGAFMRVIRSSPQFGVTLMAYEYLHTAVGSGGSWGGRAARAGS